MKSFFSFLTSLSATNNILRRRYLVETFTKLCLLEFQLKKDTNQMGWQRGSSYLPISCPPNCQPSHQASFQVSLHPPSPLPFLALASLLWSRVKSVKENLLVIHTETMLSFRGSCNFPFVPYLFPSQGEKIVVGVEGSGSSSSYPMSPTTPV